MSHRVTRLKITDYRGIEEREIQIGTAGTIAKGRNGAGKTTFVNALRAALEARDVGPDAIRLGADRAEILVDMGDITVQRVITPKTSTVKVTRGGFEIRKPQTALAELLGTSPLDPLDLYLKKKSERRALILQAIPLNVTREQLERWAPVPEGFDVAGHGLEVLDRLRQLHYDARTAANRVAKDARREAERLAGLAVNVPPCPWTLEAATREVTAAREAAAELQLRAKQATAARTRAEDARAKVAAYRDEEVKLRAEAGAMPHADVAALMRAVDQAKHALFAAENAYRLGIESNDRRALILDEAGGKAERAAAMEEAIAAGLPAEVTPDQLGEADHAIRVATEKCQEAEEAEKARANRKTADEAEATAATKEHHAGHLDAIVKRLTNEAPMELLAGSTAIPGLTLDGDDVLLDGVRLETLCGREQLRFAVDVAKRLSKSKILVCDGLERLDPESLDDFVRFATADGYQLVGTRVDRGDVVFERLESVDDEAAAPPESGARKAAPDTDIDDLLFPAPPPAQRPATMVPPPMQTASPAGASTGTDDDLDELFK